MRGPFWNNGKTGVTGEPKFRTEEPNYTTSVNSEGKTVTTVGTRVEEEE